MIKEYGIDPEVIDSAEAFYKITRYFGIEHFRLIRNFPSRWENRVWKCLQNVQPKEKLRLVEELNSLRKELVNCSYNFETNVFNYEDSADWYSNSLKYNQLNPFDGRICRQNPDLLDNICHPDDLAPDSEILSNDWRILRDSKVIAKSIKTILLYANEIHLIDPYFSTMEKRFIRPLREMIRYFELRKKMNIPMPRNFVYHTSTAHNRDINIKSILQKELAHILVSGITLKIVRWHGDELHNRAVISNIGGVMFGIGLDDSDERTVKQYDDISPLTIPRCKEFAGRKATSEKFMESKKMPSVFITGLKRV